MPSTPGQNMLPFRDEPEVRLLIGKVILHLPVGSLVLNLLG